MALTSDGIDLARNHFQVRSRALRCLVPLGVVTEFCGNLSTSSNFLEARSSDASKSFQDHRALGNSMR